MPPRLDLVDLDQTSLEGYRRFISCWLSRGAGPSFIVDPGPAATAPHLISQLRALRVTGLDFILLTHIHLDHGGAAAELLDAFPGARIVCHDRGRQHLTDPARLWEGSRQVLGEVADTYGEPRPVPAAALATYQDLAAVGIGVVETPGHAAHHVSFLHEGTIFVGEAAGTFQDLGEGRWYLRPATPPRFKLEVAVSSLDRLLALNPEPERLAFAHHGQLVGHSRELLKLAREQLKQWVTAVGLVLEQDTLQPFEELARQVVARLRATDRNFALGRALPADIRIREEDFTQQTLRGMVQYVEEIRDHGGRR